MLAESLVKILNFRSRPNFNFPRPKSQAIKLKRKMTHQINE